jgi:hypothetical protein
MSDFGNFSTNQPRANFSRTTWSNKVLSMVSFRCVAFEEIKTRCFKTILIFKCDTLLKSPNFYIITCYVWVVATFPLIYFLQLLGPATALSRKFYTTWRLHSTLKVFCNIHNKNIYNENWKIPAARQLFSVRGSVSLTAQQRTRAAQREHWLVAMYILLKITSRIRVTKSPLFNLKVCKKGDKK